MIKNVIFIYLGGADKQNENSRLQINLGLYDKRYKIYDNAKQFVVEVSTCHGIQFKDLLEFKNEIIESPFLFQNDICDYLEKIIKSAEMINKLNEKLGYQKLSEFEEKNTKDEIGELNNWFIDQARSELHKKFLNYLDFRNINAKIK